MAPPPRMAASAALALFLAFALVVPGLGLVPPLPLAQQLCWDEPPPPADADGVARPVGTLGSPRSAEGRATVRPRLPTNSSTRGGGPEAGVVATAAVAAAAAAETGGTKQCLGLSGVLKLVLEEAQASTDVAGAYAGGVDLEVTRDTPMPTTATSGGAIPAVGPGRYCSRLPRPRRDVGSLNPSTGATSYVGSRNRMLASMTRRALSPRPYSVGRVDDDDAAAVTRACTCAAAAFICKAGAYTRPLFFVQHKHFL